MIRQLSATLFSLLFILTLVSAAAGSAFAKGAHYRADPAFRPAAERVIAHDLVWRCGANGCVAGRSNSRVATECAALVREVGKLRSFSVRGETLPAKELEKCNALSR